MTEVIDLKQVSLKQGGFYVPEIEIRIEGAGLPQDVLRDVIQLTYKDSINQIDSFELTVNNWDPSTHDFKYVGAETPETLKEDTPAGRRYRLFEPCAQQVEVRMGYAGDLRTVLTGMFTTMEPTFPRNAAPTLTVRGLNKLHDLRRKQYTQRWEDKKDSDIALAISMLKDPDTGEKRFPLKIEVDENAKSREPILDRLAQQNQFDIDFLFTRARVRGYVVFVQEPDESAGRTEPILYFGPSDCENVRGRRDIRFELEWGKSLIDFRPTLSTANQILSVKVQGWNRRNRKPIIGSATTDDLPRQYNADLYRLLGCDKRDVSVVNEPVHTPAEAKKRAIAILRERQKEIVQAKGSTIGLPDLRSGICVAIKGIGSRFSGRYFVTETTHTYSDSGYVTQFTARREEYERGGRNGS